MFWIFKKPKVDYASKQKAEHILSNPLRIAYFVDFLRKTRKYYILGEACRKSLERIVTSEVRPRDKIILQALKDFPNPR